MSQNLGEFWAYPGEHQTQRTALSPCHEMKAWELLLELCVGQSWNKVKQIMGYKQQLCPSWWCLGYTWDIVPFSVKFPCIRLNFECADENWVLVWFGFFFQLVASQKHTRKGIPFELCIYSSCCNFPLVATAPNEMMLLSCLCTQPSLPFGG